MPTYHYRCSNCAHEFEQGQSIKDAPLNTCPECKQQTIHRVISAGGGAIFKGSGFYLTDYAKRPSDKGGGNTKKDVPAEKKTETKTTDPATKNTSSTNSDKTVR